MTSWPEIALADCLEHRQEQPDVSEVASGRISIIAKISFNGSLSVREAVATRTSMILARPGDLVVSGINASKGAVALYRPINGMPIAATIHYSAYRVRPEAADPDFLWYLLRSPAFRRAMSNQLPGGIKSELRAQTLLGIKVALPPVEEQRRRAQLLGAIHAKTGAVEELSLQSRGLATTLLDLWIVNLLERAGGRVVTLNACLAERPRNGVSEAPSAEGSTPILRISAATSRSDQTVNQSDVRWLSGGPGEYRSWHLQKDDLLACRFNGNRAFVGRFARVADPPVGPLIYPDKLIRFRVNPALASPQFVTLAMNYGAARRLVEALCSTTAGNVGVSARRLAEVALRLPPIEVQESVVATVRGLRPRVETLASLQAVTLDTIPSLRVRAFSAALS